MVWLALLRFFDNGDMDRWHARRVRNRVTGVWSVFIIIIILQQAVSSSCLLIR